MAVRDDRVRTSVVGSMAGKAVELLTLVLLATVVPRVLGPHDYGRLSVPLTLVTLGSLALSLGGPTVLARFVPAAPPEERLGLARALGLRLARGRGAQLAVVVAGAAIAAGVAPGTFPPLVTTLVVVALVASVAASLLLQVLLGLGRTGPWATRFPLQNAVLVVGVLLLHDRWEGTGAVVAVTASTLVALGFAIGVSRAERRARPAPVPVPPAALRFGTFHAAGAGLGQVADRAGVVAVPLLGGTATEAGFAALATGLALGVGYAVLQAFTVSLPHVAAGAGGGDAGPDEVGAAEAVLGRLAAGSLAVLLPGALVGAALLGPIVPRVAGPGYEGAAGAFGPALAFVVLAPLGALVVQVAALRVVPRASLANGAVGVVAFGLAAVALVPGHGAAGATGAMALGSAAGTAVALRLLPGAASPRLVGASVAGALAVLAVAAWA